MKINNNIVKYYYLLLLCVLGLNEIRTHDTAFKVPCANRYTIRPELSRVIYITEFITQ